MRDEMLAEIEDAIRRYGRECSNAVESFRCAEPDLDAPMGLVRKYIDADCDVERLMIAVLELHYAEQGWLHDGPGPAEKVCAHCYDPNGNPVRWPCPTARVVGVTS